MNKLTIIGRLTKDPETKTTTSGLAVCTFTVAVNKRKKDAEHPEADFFRVTAWRQLAEICKKYLAKGRQVCVIGPVSVNAYKGRDGEPKGSLEVTAEDVEFLGSRDEQQAAEPPKPAAKPEPEYLEVGDDELPF